MRKVILLVCALVGFGTSGAQQRWQIDKGAHSISWQVEEGDEHRDHIEMAGNGWQPSCGMGSMLTVPLN